MRTRVCMPPLPGTLLPSQSGQTETMSKASPSLPTLHPSDAIPWALGKCLARYLWLCILSLLGYFFLYHLLLKSPFLLLSGKLLFQSFCLPLQLTLQLLTLDQSLADREWEGASGVRKHQRAVRQVHVLLSKTARTHSTAHHHGLSWQTPPDVPLAHRFPRHSWGFRTSQVESSAGPDGGHRAIRIWKMSSERPSALVCVVLWC